MINFKKIMVGLTIGVVTLGSLINTISNNYNNVKYRNLARNVVPSQYTNKINNLEIEVISGELEKKYRGLVEEGENVLGVCIAEENKIVLETNDINRRETFIHEVAHYIDINKDVCGEFVNTTINFSEDEEFCIAYENESVLLYGENSHYTSNRREYFAQAFCDYVLGNNYSDVAPITYEFIENIFN